MFFYGLIAYAPEPDKLPWCIRQNQRSAEHSALIETEEDANRKPHNQLVWGVWNIETMQLVSMVRNGLVYRLAENTSDQDGSND